MTPTNKTDAFSTSSFVSVSVCVAPQKLCQWFFGRGPSRLARENTIHSAEILLVTSFFLTQRPAVYTLQISDLKILYHDLSWANTQSSFQGNWHFNHCTNSNISTLITWISTTLTNQQNGCLLHGRPNVFISGSLKKYFQHQLAACGWVAGAGGLYSHKIEL